MSRCGTCDAPIVWATTEAKGKLMPLDPHPDERGNVQLVRKPGASRPVARVLAGRARQDAIDMDVPLFVPHFVTCASPPARRRPLPANVVSLAERRRAKAGSR